MSEHKLHYLVIRHPFSLDRVPTVEHEHRWEAQNEASRLAAKNPGVDFRVYAFVAVSSGVVSVKNYTYFQDIARFHEVAGSP